MRKLIMIASAAAMAAAMPALAKPGGGQGGAKASVGAKAKVGGTRANVGARTAVRSNGKARTDSRADVRARTRTGASIDRTRDSDRDGIPDYREQRTSRVDANRDGIDDRTGRRYGANACPPGLAAKNNGCLPPGQAKKMFSEGQRIPTGYNFYTPYADIPSQYQSQLDPNGRYIYRDDRIYVVDPATQLVTRVIENLR